MELALPHVVVRICGPGVGPDIVAALGVHPVEVTEARDASELRRVAGGRPAILVVVTDPPDTRAAIAETWHEFPRTPVLIVGGSTPDTRQPPLVTEATGKDWIDSVSGGLSLPDVCWHVMEAIGRAALLPSVSEHPLGPVSIEVDDKGCVVQCPNGLEGLLVDGRRIRAGESLLPFIDPCDRDMLTHMLGQQVDVAARFMAIRVHGRWKGRHVVSAGIRHLGQGRVAMLLQPLVSDGPIVGRHINNRDPITGLLTRWAMSRSLEEHEQSGPTSGSPVLLLLKLQDFAAVSEYIGPRATDVVLVRVASALNQVLPYPAISSREMGDTFLTCLPDSRIDEAVHRAEQVIHAVNGIDVPGFSPGFQVRASVGIAGVSRKDYDLAIRLADVAADAARAGGGNRAIVAGSTFTGGQRGDLTTAMDVGSWELWLQPVAGQVGGQAAFYEALARFGNGRGRVVSRVDFFVAGRAQGLLERFDRMMLQRVLAILAAHPDLKLSINVTFESFMSEGFPSPILDLVTGVPDASQRIILEISPRCLASAETGAKGKLEALAAAGIAVAVDDFGSGICRLRYLTQLPLAMVKLDELVTGYVADDPLQREFVRTVANICHARGITTIAEYTRSEEQMARLVADGVDLFQGELLGMPAPAADVLAPRTVEASSA